jgi:hypothetical protein
MQMLSTLQPEPRDWWQVPDSWAPPNQPVFEKCPYRNRCFSDGCTNFTEGPLCAVCSSDHFRDSTGVCAQCTETTVSIKIATLSSIFMVLLLLVWSQRKRIQRLRAKYGSAWRDIVRILTINLSYCQISSSLPGMIQIPWPTKYLELLDKLSFVNIDVVSLLGMKCVGGDFWDFSGRLVIACLVPPLVVMLCFIIYVYRQSHVKRRAKHGTTSMKEMTTHSVDYLWDMFDLDDSGEIDEDEFHNLLIHLKASPEHVHPQASDMRREIMKDLKAVKRHNVHHRHKHMYVVLRPHFVELVASGKMGDVLRDDWILWAERQRIREHFLSDMLLVLFLLHAPLSQRGFYFFACSPVGNKQFLSADYTIECFQDKHKLYEPVAILFLGIFSFLFPLLVLLKLCQHHRNLRTPEIRHKFGFLYASFNRGGEYWELHEVFRKMILTGLLVFIPGSSRPAVAILVSVMSVASLNYVKPHKNYLVFWVAQISFLLTTFKYLSVILLATTSGPNSSSGITSITAEGEQAFDSTSDVIGTLLIILDITFMVSSLFTMVAVIMVLRSVLSKVERKELSNGSVPDVSPTLYDEDLKEISKWRAFDHKKALEHAKVTETENETQRAHDAAMKELEKKSQLAHSRLMGRVKKRNSITGMTGAIHLNSMAKVVPKADEQKLESLELRSWDRGEK